MPSNWLAWVAVGSLGAMSLATATTGLTAEPLPWQRQTGVYAQNDSYRPNERYEDRRDDRDRPDDSYRVDDSHRPGDRSGAGGGDPYDDGNRYDDNVGEPYEPPRAERYEGDGRDGGYSDEARREAYSESEIIDAGHRFFGSVSTGLARVVEYAFKRQGRPNGYILGDDAGGAFVAGLRYGEGVLYTKYDGDHKVFWQGPSIGYDFGGEGSKTMVLVYNLRDPSDIYRRFAGVEGSAYFVGGVGIQFQKHGDVVLAPIRSGVGLRLGANVGYLKYTRSPTLNPF